MINEGRPDERTLAHGIGDLEPLAQGDTVTHYTTGGGGYGPPSERPLERVRADLRDGLLSIDAAERFYGVRLDTG